MSASERPAAPPVGPAEAGARLEPASLPLAQALLELDELEQALRLLCGHAGTLLDATAVTLWLVDGDGLVPFGPTSAASDGPRRVAITDASAVVAEAARERRLPAANGSQAVGVPVLGRGGVPLAVLEVAGGVAACDAASWNARVEALAALAAATIDRMRLRAAVRERDASLAANNQRKAEFMAMVSHELRTPLNVVLGYADLLLEEVFGPLPEEQRDAVERVHAGARELLELVSATVDIGRLEAGELKPVMQPVDAAEIVESLVAEAATRPGRGAVDLRFTIASGLPTLVTDADKLRTVLRNLLNNAVKFTSQGHVAVSVEAAPTAMVFTIEDTGIGIRPEHLAIIWDMFRQAEPTDTRSHGGLGLGLWIVRRLVDDLGGEVSVWSEVGTGSRFRVALPLSGVAR